MAITGKYPILLVGLVDVLTPYESQILKQLSAMTTRGTMAPEDVATKEALQTKAEALSSSSLSLSDLARLPIIFDGEIIPAVVSNYNTTMVKQISVFENANIVSNAANTVSISIRTSRSEANNMFVDLLFSIADIIFSKSDIAPSVSYFGGSVVIPNGYLIRLTRSGKSDDSEEVITMEIAKDLSFLFENETTISILGTSKQNAAPVNVLSGWEALG